jgi:predicted Rossmann fold nucleotide-binding protein DprA/Smf involved in DNA uptake
MKNEATYWITLAHLPKWGFGKINALIVRFFHEEKISIEDFFNLSESDWSKRYLLAASDILDLQNAKSELPNNAFLAESLLSQGYQMVPITSPDYSRTLKLNLKATQSPSLLYVKGNREILHQPSVAIVGSREADGKSMDFADNIARLASKEYKVVVSGFAKGIDKQALDSAIHYKGQSIIVLPQGIATFNSGFKTYYKQIVDGDLLVLSTFPPKAGWSVPLAMARNPIIYGLADEIYVAESSEKGGTWAGVVDGLRKGRKILVRYPDPGEKNANAVLIQKGAVPVDFNGAEIQNHSFTHPLVISLQESKPLDSPEDIPDRILSALNGKPLSPLEILDICKLNISVGKLTTLLKGMELIQSQKYGKTTKYLLKSKLSAPEQKELFT